MRNRCAWHVWLHCREFLIYPEIFHRWTARDIKASVVDMADDRPIRCQWEEQSCQRRGLGSDSASP